MTRTTINPNVCYPRFNHDRSQLAEALYNWLAKGGQVAIPR